MEVLKAPRMGASFGWGVTMSQVHKLLLSGGEACDESRGCSG